jgi:hypothetical protein
MGASAASAQLGRSRLRRYRTGWKPCAPRYRRCNGSLKSTYHYRLEPGNQLRLPGGRRLGQQNLERPLISIFGVFGRCRIAPRSSSP